MSTMHQCQCALFLLLLQFTWIGRIHTLDPSCLRLSGSQECRAFQDYAVNTLAAPWIRNSTNIDDLDKLLRQYVNQQQWWWQGNGPDNDNNNTMNQLCESDGTEISARYSKTVLCDQLVRASPDCNVFNSTPPALCNDTCSGFVNSITTCYTTNAMLLYQQCPSTSDKAACINGYENEQFCGWADGDKGCTYCQAEPNDPCCTTLYEKGICSSLNTQQLISAILGSVFGCLLLFGCIWYWCCGYHRHKQWSLPGPLSKLFLSTTKNRISSSTSQEQRNSLLPWRNPIKDDDKSGMGEKAGTNNTSNDINDMQRTDDMITIHSTMDTLTTTNTYTDETFMTLSYTLAKKDATGYCFYQAIYVNVPSRPEDIVLEKGDLVYLHCYTNEDWGIGYNIATGQQGSFPMICICSLPLNQVWEWVYTYPIIKHRSLLKHRVSYFISSAKEDDDDAEADDEHDMVDDTRKKAVIKMKTKRIAGTTSTAMTKKNTLTPSSDDEESPLTPPPPTLSHRILGKKNKSTGHSKRWIGGGSSN